MNIMKWFSRLTNTMDIADATDTDRMAWDKDYRANLIRTLETGAPVENLQTDRLPAFPAAMRRMVAFLGLNERQEWSVHEADMRTASRTCDNCPDYDACLKASVPLTHLCPNRDRFERMSGNKAA